MLFRSQRILITGITLACHDHDLWRLWLYDDAIRLDLLRDDLSWPASKNMVVLGPRFDRYCLLHDFLCRVLLELPSGAARRSVCWIRNGIYFQRDCVSTIDFVDVDVHCRCGQSPSCIAADHFLEVTDGLLAQNASNDCPDCTEVEDDCAGAGDNSNDRMR